MIIAMGSTGLHSNGYSLARKVLLEIDRMNLAGHVEEFGRTLGEELLEPTRIYAKDCLALAAETQVRTFCHVTGGGLAGNLERVIPPGLVGRTRPRHVDARAGVRDDRPARPDRARRDGEDVQHGRRHGRRRRAGGHRPCAGDPDRAASELLDARHHQRRAARMARARKLVGQHPRF